MKRIKNIIQAAHHKVLNIYFTAGYPEIGSMPEIITALDDFGVDLIEIGIPYSDPLADGPIIQQGNTVALQNGMTLPLLLHQLQSLPVGKIKAGLILMGYLNPILQYGFELFCADAAKAGVQALILPDLPLHEYQNEYADLLRKYGLDFIFLITPETSEERIRLMDKCSDAFLYAVTSSSTTGSEKNMEQVSKYLIHLQSMHLKNPVLVGFGIKDKTSFDAACLHADGAIIGSAYIKFLEWSTDVRTDTKTFIQSIKN